MLLLECAVSLECCVGVGAEVFVDHELTFGVVVGQEVMVHCSHHAHLSSLPGGIVFAYPVTVVPSQL